MDSYELMKEAWDAAVNQCALVQERGWKYTPLTFDQWFTLNHTCNAGHNWQPVIGMDNEITDEQCLSCGAFSSSICKTSPAEEGQTNE